MSPSLADPVTDPFTSAEPDHAMRDARRDGSSDAELLEHLYREHADRVFGLCLRMSGDRERALELAQDVFVRVWRKLHLLRREADPGAWIWRVATNVVLNALRSDRRRLARVSAEGMPADAEALGRAADPATPLPIRRMDISIAVARLPERARVIYLLHDVEGFSTEEIAERLGIAAGTVRAQLHRARGIMRRILLP